MKSIQTMQDELLKRAKFDGSYPKAVFLPPMFIALAHDEAQYEQLMHESRMLSKVITVIFLGVAAFAVASLIWLAWRLY